MLGISPGIGSVFELLPPQNATGNWIKVVRRVPVRIGLQSEDVAAHPLLLGLSMAVDLDVRDTSGPLLGESPTGQTSHATTFYQDEAELRDQAIDEHPIVNLTLLARRNFTVGAITMSLGYMTFFGAVIILPLWLQTQEGYTAT